MRAVLDRWMEPASAQSLGLVRIVFFFSIWLLYLSKDRGVWGGAPSLFWEPFTTFSTLGIPQPGPYLETLEFCWKLSLLTACIGWWTRTSCAVAGGMGFYVLGSTHCFGKFSHEDAVLVMTFFVLALSRCGDALSVDAWRTGVQRERHFAYGWPPRVVCFLVCNMLFWAGVSKWTAARFHWGQPEQLRNLTLVMSYGSADGIPFNGGRRLLEHAGWLFEWMGPATLFVELGAPLALLHPYLKLFFGSLALLFLVGVRVVLGPDFTVVLPLFLFWLPWDRLFTFLLHRAGKFGHVWNLRW